MGVGVLSKPLPSFIIHGNRNTGSLTEQAISALRTKFSEYGHEPSPAMWAGIKALLETLERMADGDLAPAAYLSPLDPGVGKTLAVVAFVLALLRSGWHADVGVLICVSRLEEIATLIGKMHLAKDDVAVYTADETINALGSDDIDSARILFVTQQMVSSRLSDGKPFGSLDRFHFCGQPRQVRIWDEAMLPAEELTLTVDALARLPSLVRQLSSPLADRMHALCEEVRSLKDGQTCIFPDLEEEYGVTFEDAKTAFAKQPTRDREAAHALWHLSGKTVRVA